MGLAFGSWAPVGEDGKICDAAEWLVQLEQWEEPQGYRTTYERWLAGLRESRALIVRGVLASRALVGHGLSSPFDVGLAFNHTWGCPIIPGTALKGLLAHYICATFGPDDQADHPVLAARGEEVHRADFQGPTRRKNRVKEGAGRYYRALFGAPEADCDIELKKKHPELLAHFGSCRGLIQFHDAWYVPSAAQGDHQTGPYAKDVLTVHHGQYYQNPEAQPNDYEEPNPVAFLSVRPKTTFLIALTGNAEWMKLAMTYLKAALEVWGVGGKTAAGYGRFAADRWSSDTLAAFEDWIRDNSPWEGGQGPPTARQRLGVVKSEWMQKLLDLDANERKHAAQLIRRRIKSKPVKEESAEIAERIEKDEAP